MLSDSVQQSYRHIPRLVGTIHAEQPSSFLQCSQPAALHDVVRKAANMCGEGRPWHQWEDALNSSYGQRTRDVVQLDAEGRSLPYQRMCDLLDECAGSVLGAICNNRYDSNE